jgi:hypothetical protein
MESVYAQVAAMIAAEPDTDHSGSGIGGAMRRLCRAATRGLGASGAGLTLLTDSGSRGLNVASDAHAEILEDLQFTSGEGPCVDAYARRRPVLVADFGDGTMRRWPGYAPLAYERGVRAVFAFPLQIGAARLGTLDVFRSQAGTLTAQDVTLALAFAEVAVSTVLDDHQQALGRGHRDGLDAAFGSRAELFQAQGMVMVQIGASITDAMATIRAYAFSHDISLADLARDIVGRRITFATTSGADSATE